MLPVSERQLLERSIEKAVELAATDRVLLGAAVLHARLLRAQRLLANRAAWSLELLQCSGAALDHYLQEHRLYTYVACRSGGFYSLEIQPAHSGDPDPDRELVTLVFFRGVRVEAGRGDEPLVYRDGEPGGFTLNTALENGWGCVLDDALSILDEAPNNLRAANPQPGN